MNQQVIIKNKWKRDLTINQIKYNKETLRCLYYLVGDGSFTKGIYLSNINYRLHKDFVRVFGKYFDIKTNEWILSVTFNENFNENNITNSKLFWKRQLKEVDRVYKTKFNTYIVGDLKVIYDSINLSRFLVKNINHINEKIHKDKLGNKQLCYVLDGILNAEGGAQIDKIGLHKITISFNKYKIEEKELFNKILENLEIKKYSRIEQNKNITFSRWFNHYQFIKIFTKNNIMPFSLSPKRSYNLFSGFLKHQKIKTLTKYLNIINEKDNQSLKEINSHLNYDISSIQEAIKKFKPFGFYTINKNKNAYKVSITDEGKTFLEVTRKSKKWLNKSIKQLEKDKMEEKFPFERVQRKVLVKSEVETDKKYGCDPNKRPLNELITYGIVNINKTQGPTSHQVTDYVKKIMHLDKAGHSGTLA